MKKKTKGKQTKKEERGKISQTNEYEKEGEDDGKRKGANKNKLCASWKVYFYQYISKWIKMKRKQTKKEQRKRFLKQIEYEKEEDDDGKRKGANKKQTLRSLGQQK